MRLLLAFALSAGMAASSVAAQPQPALLTRHQAAACLEAPDPPVCLMRLAVRARPQDAVAFELGWFGHPDLTSSLALTVEGFDAARPPVLISGDVQQEMARDIWRALERARDDAAPENVLAPLLARPVRDYDVHKMRAERLRDFWRAFRFTGLDARRPDLVKITLARWEKERAAVKDDPFDLDLAEAYFDVGDEAAVQRQFQAGGMGVGEVLEFHVDYFVQSKRWAEASAAIERLPAEKRTQARADMAEDMDRAGYTAASVEQALIALSAPDRSGLRESQPKTLVEIIVCGGTLAQQRDLLEIWGSASVGAKEANAIELLLFQAHARVGDKAWIDEHLAAHKVDLRLDDAEPTADQLLYAQMLVASGQTAALERAGWRANDILALELDLGSRLDDLDVRLAGMSEDAGTEYLLTCLEHGQPAARARCWERVLVRPNTPESITHVLPIVELTTRDLEQARRLRSSLLRRWRDMPDGVADGDVVWLLGWVELYLAGRYHDLDLG